MASLQNSIVRWRSWPSALEISRKCSASAARRFTHDATEADMTGGGIRGFALTGGWPVAQAIVWRAKMRATLHHPAHGPVIAGAGMAARLLWLIRRRAMLILDGRIKT